MRPSVPVFTARPLLTNHLQVQTPDSSQGHEPFGNFEQAKEHSASEGPSAPGAATHPAASTVVVVYTIVVLVVAGGIVVTAPWQEQTPDSSHGQFPAGKFLQAVAQSSSEGPYAPTPSAAMQVEEVTEVVDEGGAVVMASHVHTPDSSQGHMPSGTKPQM